MMNLSEWHVPSIIVREEADIDRIAERIVQKVKETNDNLPQTAVA